MKYGELIHTQVGTNVEIHLELIRVLFKAKKQIF